MKDDLSDRIEDLSIKLHETMLTTDINDSRYLDQSRVAFKLREVLRTDKPSGQYPPIGDCTCHRATRRV